MLVSYKDTNLGVKVGEGQSNISDFFQTMKVRFEKCLDPTLSCTEKAINAHSVQNATSLGLIAEDNHVYELRMRVKNGSPECLFEKVGRNQASTFPGFCSRHDTEIFQPIDTKPLSLDDAEQLFLIAYRSLTRELHTVMEAAMRLQTTLERQIAEGLVPKDKPSPAMTEATAHMIKAWGVWKHRLEFYDQPFAKTRFGDVLHSRFVIEGRKPVLASSSFFSVDDKAWGKRFAAVTLNVIPHIKDGSRRDRELSEGAVRQGPPLRRADFSEERGRAAVRALAHAGGPGRELLRISAACRELDCRETQGDRRGVRRDGDPGRSGNIVVGSDAILIPRTRVSGNPLRPPLPVPPLDEPPRPRRHLRSLRRAISRNGEVDAAVNRAPLGDDGDAIAKLDKAFRFRLPVVADRDAPAPEGMDVGEYETHGAAP